MESYNEFAYVYDRLIDRDYAAAADRIEEMFEKYGVKPELVLDIACGTGTLTGILAERGYDMIGLDLSEDMLSVAAAKNPGIRFLHQDMTEFELYGTVDAIVCTLDAVNYVTDKRKLKKMFRLVNNYLNPGGLFIFDINTRYKLETVLGNNTFVYDEDGIFYVWENYFDKKSDISRQLLTFFSRDGREYKRFDEQHVQRAYNADEIRNLLAFSGLSLCEISDCISGKTPRKNAEKIIFVSKKIC